MRSFGTFSGKGQVMPKTAKPIAVSRDEAGICRSDFGKSDYDPESGCDRMRKSHYSKEELISASAGTLFGNGSPLLPSGPLLTLDRVVDIRDTGGEYEKGYAVAEWRINSSSWFFKHHFKNDPVVPGTLLLESLWQLTGFHLAWSGYKGYGRVVGNGRTRFLSEVNDEDQILTVSIHIRKVFTSTGVMCIADGKIDSATNCVCEVDAINVGLVSK